MGPPSKKAKQQKKEKGIHDKVRNQASRVVNFREEIKTLYEDLQDLEQQDQEEPSIEWKTAIPPGVVDAETVEEGETFE